jgi:hypothetical protein
MAGPSGENFLGASSLHEDSNRFYAVSVLALEDSRLRIASVEWYLPPVLSAPPPNTTISLPVHTEE